MDFHPHATVLDAFPVTFDKQAALDAIITHPGGEKLLDLTFLHAISMDKGKKKRTLSLSHDDDEEGEDGATSADGSDATETPQHSKATAAKKKEQQPTKQRKPTHVVRR
ncbi:hypothetical protein Gpo141_00014356, partial [Globisporangium polare]